MKNQKPPKKPTGPKPDRVKIEGDWEGAVGKALALKRPKEGWTGLSQHMEKLINRRK